MRHIFSTRFATILVFAIVGVVVLLIVQVVASLLSA